MSTNFLEVLPISSTPLKLSNRFQKVLNILIDAHAPPVVSGVPWLQQPQLVHGQSLLPSFRSTGSRSVLHEGYAAVDATAELVAAVHLRDHRSLRLTRWHGPTMDPCVVAPSGGRQ